MLGGGGGGGEGQFFFNMWQQTFTRFCLFPVFLVCLPWNSRTTKELLRVRMGNNSKGSDTGALLLGKIYKIAF